MATKPTKESDIAAAVIQWLRADEWEIFQEVEDGGRRCDIVAKRGKIVSCIEVKTGLGLQVIKQAQGWRNRCHYCFCATPSRGIGRNSWETNLCQSLGVGLIGVRSWGSSMHFQTIDVELDVELLADAPLNRKPIMLIQTCEQQKTIGVAGSKDNYYRRTTPYQETKALLIRMVEFHPGIELKKAIEEIKHHYSSNKSAYSTLVTYIQDGVIKELKIVRESGKTQLFPNG